MTKIKKQSIFLILSGIFIWGVLRIENNISCRATEKFTKSVWLQGLEDLEEGGERLDIAKKLSDCDVLIGMNKASLILMLGKPHRTRLSTKFNFWLGPQHDSYIRIDSDWLTVWLENDKVVRSEITTD